MKNFNQIKKSIANIVLATFSIVFLCVAAQAQNYSTGETTITAATAAGFATLNVAVQTTEAGVFVTWATTSETNSNYFTIERSSNGRDFTEIARINGAGTSTVTINYGYADKNPLNGISYYRLKQTDFDGQYSYSSIESLVFNGNTRTFNVSKLSPTKLAIHFPETEATNYVAVYTIIGELVFEQTVPAGHKNFTIAKELQTGYYIVCNEYNGNKQSKKVKI
ncbi:MAG: hypothetical protein FWC39_07425 [Bacteroidetes bacterium]|nr:hypothetical protein [Bacteroidota bacterium]